MAETLLTSVAKKLAEIAVTSVVAEVQLQLGTDDNIRFIKNELSSIKAFLRDAETKSLRGDAVAHEWVLQVRDEAYRVEGVIEEFFLQMEILNSRRRNMGGPDIKCFICYIPSHFKQRILCHQFHTQIEIIKKDVEDISNRRLRYKIQEGSNIGYSAETSIDHLGVSSPFHEETDIIGIDNIVSQLQEELQKEEEPNQRSIVSLVGMAGSGKTTIAKKVFTSIKGQFECSAWVPVSQRFELRRILKRILEELHKSRNEAPPSGMEWWSILNFEEMICNYLQGKRYILVLDDIWDVNAWEVIKKSLPRNVIARIVITTRIVDVASPLGENNYVHHVEKLNFEFSWELFCRKAFNGPPGSCPDYLKEIGQSLVRKCDGLPLAIVAIGGLMSRKGTNPVAWDDVLQNLDWDLNSHQDLNRLNNVLLTSYDYLPYALKYCFLYCGLFPEDSTIKRSRLIRMWVAEGFIEGPNGRTLEEVAVDHFAQLVNRNLLQSTTSHEWEMRWVACSVHDLVRDMAVQLSRTEEFGAVFKIQDNNFFRRGYRCAWLHDSEAPNVPSAEMAYQQGWEHLRSFLVFQDEIQSATLRQLFSNMKFLKVLDLSGANIKHLPNEVGDLIYLRYLGLGWTKIDELPLSINKLYNLQTLDVRNTKVECLPPRTYVATFKQLRHLLMFSASRSEVERDIVVHIMGGSSRRMVNSLSNLQTLSAVDANKRFVSQLGYLTGLRKLGIRKMRTEYCTEVCAAIKKMKYLGTLLIAASDFDDILDLETVSQPPRYLQKLKLFGKLKGLPHWIGGLNSVHTIVLVYNDLSEDPLRILAKLPNLERLWVADAYKGRKMSWVSDGRSKEGFPKLRSLVIRELYELEEFDDIEEGTMHRLCDFTIVECPKLKKMPSGIQHLKLLHNLELGDMPEDLAKRLRNCDGEAREGGEDHWMVQHVPNIWITKREILDGPIISFENIGLAGHKNKANDQR